MKVGLLGATGLVGMQLATLLSRHKFVRQLDLFSRSHFNQYLWQIYPHLKGILEHKLLEPSPKILAQYDTFFLAIPHGSSMHVIKELGENVQVVDLGADFRIREQKLYEETYRQLHVSPELLASFAYGISELNMEEIRRNAFRIANPGCIATAILLGLYPLLHYEASSEPVFTVDAKLGSSGGGISLRSEFAALHVSRANAVRVHKIHQHRHAAEVTSFLKTKLGFQVVLSINTYSVDLVRGISCSIYFKPVQGMTANELNKLYKEFYSEHPFVRIFSHKVGHEQYPNPKLLVGLNLCDIKVHIAGTHGVIVSALDNLMKGAAGQAVQNFNLINGYPLPEGLNLIPVYPI